LFGIDVTAATPLPARATNRTIAATAIGGDGFVHLFFT
jgi:hypothetical protein